MKLNDNISMTCSKYDYTDTLLCHDDQVEGRKIAFVYYLVPEWTAEDGGALDLFDADATTLYPRAVVKSFLPSFNNFVFFEVNEVSYHQVSEILTPTKSRLSINGWFHGSPTSWRTALPKQPEPFASPVPLGLEVLSDWINPYYLDVGVQAQIQQQFESDSQIELPNFFMDEQYCRLCEELKAESCQWTSDALPNMMMRHLLVADRTTVSPLVASCLTLIQSEPFCLLLSHITGLDLAENVIRPSLEDDVTENHHDVAGHSVINVDSTTGKCDNVVAENDSDGYSLKTEVTKVNIPAERSEVDEEVTRKEIGVNDKGNGEPCVSFILYAQEPTDRSTLIDPGTDEYSGEAVKSKVAANHASNVVTATGSVSCGESATSSPVECRCELQHWLPGDYTQASDCYDPPEGFTLDGRLFFSTEDWSADVGGVTSYIAKDDKEELLSISPAANALSLVYRESGTIFFTKYINHRSSEPDASSFFTLLFQCRETKPM